MVYSGILLFRERDDNPRCAVERESYISMGHVPGESITGRWCYKGSGDETILRRLMEVEGRKSKVGNKL